MGTFPPKSTMFPNLLPVISNIVLAAGCTCYGTTGSACNSFNCSVGNNDACGSHGAYVYYYNNYYNLTGYYYYYYGCTCPDYLILLTLPDNITYLIDNNVTTNSFLPGNGTTSIGNVSHNIYYGGYELSPGFIILYNVSFPFGDVYNNYSVLNISFVTVNGSPYGIFPLNFAYYFFSTYDFTLKNVVPAPDGVSCNAFGALASNSSGVNANTATACCNYCCGIGP
jgi:hypothetical protein